MDVFIWIITLCVSFTCIETLNCQKESKCKISRIRSMTAADCFRKDMRAFSRCLPKDVEVIDVSSNRIRKITKEELEKYSNIKMLYLNDNLIQFIDEESFKGKDYLHTLDLSMNGITKLPLTLFKLPSLKSLYLGHNMNMNIVEVAEKAKPVTSPLYHLDISYIMTEKPNELPEFGLLPSLEKYNMSGNKVISVTTKHFAGLCSLKTLDTTNVSIEYEDRCDCWTVNRWLKNRKVAFKPFICTSAEPECEDDDVAPDDLKLYEECEEEIREILRKSKVKTILLIVIPISCVVILAALIYFAMRRRQKSKQKNKEEDIMLNSTVSSEKYIKT